MNYFAKDYKKDFVMERTKLKIAIVDRLELIVRRMEHMTDNKENISQLDWDCLKDEIRSLYTEVIRLERISEHEREKKELLIAEIFEDEFSKPKPSVAHSDNGIEKKITNPVDKTVEKIESTPEPVTTPIAEEKPLAIEILSENKISPVEDLPLLQVEVIEEEKVKPEAKPEKPASVNSMLNRIRETAPAEKPKHETHKNDYKPLDIFSSLQTIADKYKDNNTSLNDSIGQNQKETLNTSFKHPASDLRSLIGINEKFLFINELFKGNMKEYTDTIGILNDAENSEDALAYLDELQQKHMWKKDELAFRTLIDFVQRRF